MTRWTGPRLVKDKLIADGRIEAYDAVYQMTDPDGNPHRITRLAAVIHTLRHRDGWDIETRQEPGMLAVYVLNGPPPPDRAPVRRPRRLAARTGAGEPLRPVAPGTGPTAPRTPRFEWECPECHAELTVTTGLDPNMGTGKCFRCHKTSTVRRNPK